jgi:hypothetical protein
MMPQSEPKNKSSIAFPVLGGASLGAVGGSIIGGRLAHPMAQNAAAQARSEYQLSDEGSKLKSKADKYVNRGASLRSTQQHRTQMAVDKVNDDLTNHLNDLADMGWEARNKANSVGRSIKGLEEEIGDLQRKSNDFVSNIPKVPGKDGGSVPFGDPLMAAREKMRIDRELAQKVNYLADQKKVLDEAAHQMGVSREAIAESKKNVSAKANRISTHGMKRIDKLKKLEQEGVAMQRKFSDTVNVIGNGAYMRKAKNVRKAGLGLGIGLGMIGGAAYHRRKDN